MDDNYRQWVECMGMGVGVAVRVVSSKQVWLVGGIYGCG